MEDAWQYVDEIDPQHTHHQIDTLTPINWIKHLNNINVIFNTKSDFKT